MIRGRFYRIRYRSPSMRYDREAVMAYLDTREGNLPGFGVHLFSARPTAGTQEIPVSWMIGTPEEVIPGTPVYVNRRAKPREGK